MQVSYNHTALLIVVCLVVQLSEFNNYCCCSYHCLYAQHNNRIVELLTERPGRERASAAAVGVNEVRASIGETIMAATQERRQQPTQLKHLTAVSTC